MSRAAMLAVLAMCAVCEGSVWRPEWSRQDTGPPSTRPTTYDLHTKTPYWSPAAEDTCAEQSAADFLGGAMTCRVVQLQHIGRHGSRNTDNEDFDALEELLATYGGAIGNPALQFLKNWTNPFARDTEDQLNSKGMQEMYHMGRRYKARYGGEAGPMGPSFNPTHHKIRHTYVSRTSSSASAFALSAFQEKEGMLGWAGLHPVSMYSMWNGGEDGMDGDVELRFHDNCVNVALKKDDDGWFGNVNMDTFKAGNLTEILVPRVAAKLGLNTSQWNLKYKHVGYFYEACTYSTAALDIPADQSPCAVFEEYDYELLAFAEDMEEYYKIGYGDDLMAHMACPLLKSMVQGMKTFVGGERDVTANLRFAHAETVVPLLVLLGMYGGDANITWDMSWDDAVSREWRTSTFGFMGCNVDMVLHECTDGAAVQHVVELRKNERQVDWPKCGTQTNVRFCSVDDIIAAYPSAEVCSYDDMCGN